MNQKYCVDNILTKKERQFNISREWGNKFIVHNEPFKWFITKVTKHWTFKKDIHEILQDFDEVKRFFWCFIPETYLASNENQDNHVIIQKRINGKILREINANELSIMQLKDLEKFISNCIQYIKETWNVYDIRWTKGVLRKKNISQRKRIYRLLCYLWEIYPELTNPFRSTNLMIDVNNNKIRLVDVINTNTCNKMDERSKLIRSKIRNTLSLFGLKYYKLLIWSKIKLKWLQEKLRINNNSNYPPTPSIDP